MLLWMDILNVYMYNWQYDQSSLDEKDEKLKDLVKMAVTESLETALQAFKGSVEEALKSHMSHQGFIRLGSLPKTGNWVMFPPICS
jgi:hypothetical protein